MILTGKQIRELNNMIDDDEEEIAIEHIDDGHSGKGLYAWYSEYPEEGSVLLDNKQGVREWVKI